jgi:hypothetical protein
MTMLSSILESLLVVFCGMILAVLASLAPSNSLSELFHHLYAM